MCLRLHTWSTACRCVRTRSRAGRNDESRQEAKGKANRRGGGVVRRETCKWCVPLEPGPQGASEKEAGQGGRRLMIRGVLHHKCQCHSTFTLPELPNQLLRDQNHHYSPHPRTCWLSTCRAFNVQGLQLPAAAQALPCTYQTLTYSFQQRPWPTHAPVGFQYAGPAASSSAPSPP